MSCVHELFDTARLNAISITEVARRLGEVRRAGSVYKTYCPWHEDRHPSLTLYERTNENRCHCFACGRGGSVIDFVMQHESWTFQQRVRNQHSKGRFAAGVASHGVFAPATDASRCEARRTHLYLYPKGNGGVAGVDG